MKNMRDWNPFKLSQKTVALMEVHSSFFMKCYFANRRIMVQFKHSAFSLIEIMLVVVIIGILSAIAYPNLQKYVVQSRQVEAKTNLSAIYSAEKLFYATNQEYSTDLAALGVGQEAPGNARYDYVVTATDNSFEAKGTGNIDEDATDDVWTIDENKDLVNVTNDVLD